MREKKSLKKVVDAIDKGTNAVEEIHQSIAELPLRIIEQSEILGAAAKEVRQFQNRTIGSIYDVIRGVNRTLGSLLAELAVQVRKRPTRRSRIPARRHAALHAGTLA